MVLTLSLTAVFPGHSKQNTPSWKPKHIYLRKVVCLSFMCPLLALPLPRAFFAAATNSTNQTNKAGSKCH